jgi:hypothetical protein
VFALKYYSETLPLLKEKVICKNARNSEFDSENISSVSSIFSVCDIFVVEDFADS